ncbi:MAG: acyltransferase family protein [Actinomycetota bacterium]
MTHPLGFPDPIDDPGPPPPTTDARRYDASDIEQPAPSPAPRRHDLDALRGFAMLLGIALHAAIPFVPYWSEGDPGGGLLTNLFEFIHGFRMPLFFLLSGNFTTMLWRRRGLRSLIDHRLRRVGLPLLAGLAVVLPLVVGGIIVGYVISGDDARFADVGGAYDDDLDQPGADDEVASESDEEDEFSFAHLWFLWFLLWLVAGFAAVVRVVERLAIRRGRDRPVPTRLVTAALVAVPVVAVVPAVAMEESVFGPDTSETIVPDVAVLAYYACFFAFGALAFDRHTHADVPLIDAVGRWWPVQLAVGSVVLYPVGRALMDDRWSASVMLQVAFAWTLTFGLLGAFRRFLSTESSRIRWLSDASYWMYLMHLPLVFVAQGIVAALGVPPLVGFVLVCVAVVPPLLASYRSWVRYRFVGTLLNGERDRSVDDARRGSVTD